MSDANADCRTRLDDLRRPRLLLRAARFGLPDYRRDRDLKRLIDMPVSPEAALSQLLTQEGRMEENRQSGNACYSISGHIDLLIAVLAEARLLLRPM